MIFDRYRSKSKTRPDEEKTSSSSTTKKTSLANTLFRKFPIHLSSSKKKLYKKQQQQQTIIDHPRISLSLPNIFIDTTAINKPKPSPSLPPPVPAPTVPLIKQRKRHSAEQRRTPRRTHHLKEDVTRHSYTFGHLTIPTNKKTLTPDELTFSSEQLEKLTRLVDLPDNTEHLLSQLGTQTTHPVPHRSMSHQQLTLNTPVSNNNILLFRQNLNRAHSESHAKNIKLQDSIEPEELVEILELQEQNVILIDVRNLMEYQKNRIRGSINVNLPSLLIKRYQRGTVSNFNLENFITTVEGRELYQLANVATIKKPLTTTTTTTILEQKAAEAELKKKQKSKVWVVYDDDMLQQDQTSQAWTLLNVLNRVGGGKMYYLNGGFNAFHQQFKDWTESSSPSSNSTSLPSPSLSTTSTTCNNNSTSILNNIPRRSISYTIGDSKNDLSKRTSLFSLDTQAARVNNANALARRANRRSQQTVNPTNSTSSTISTIQLPPITSKNLLHTASSASSSSVLFPPSFSNQLIRVTEDEDELSGMLTADTSPRTESDFGFVISEIIPGFLFVGPEIENKDHADQLNARSIRRVLNMAEECQDEGLDKESFVYHKISARDTLEMKNIELVMMEGVHFIGKRRSIILLYSLCVF